MRRCAARETLRAHGLVASKSISHWLLQLKEKWKNVRDMADIRKKNLEEAGQYQQVWERDMGVCHNTMWEGLRRGNRWSFIDIVHEVSVCMYHVCK